MLLLLLEQLTTATCIMVFDKFPTQRCMPILVVVQILDRVIINFHVARHAVPEIEAQLKLTKPSDSMSGFELLHTRQLSCGSACVSEC